jgi:exopolysaccharide biosynthesis protein
MYKRPLLLLLLSFCFISAFPQDADSIVFVRSHWTKKRIASKTALIKHHFNAKNLFASNQNISYLEVKNKGKAPVFEIGSEVSVLKPTSAFGLASGARAAINGTFFDVKNGGSVDFIKVSGKIINETRLEKNNSRAKHQEAAVVIQDGKLSLKKWNGIPDWERTLTDGNVMVTGPLLSINNTDEALDSGAFSTTRHPRSAIGIKPNGRVILLTVDGRNVNSAGMSLFELRKIMKWIGCTSAINLDGGGSTTLWIQGFPDNGVVNYPTDNKLWNHAGERKVANVILLKKKP